MSALAARVAAFLVAPAFPAEAPRPQVEARRAGRRAARGRGDAAGVVAVVGTGAAPLAVDLAAALAGRARRPVAVTAVWGDRQATSPRGQAVGPAARLAATIAAGPAIEDGAVVAGGTGVVLRLPEDPAAAVVALDGARASADDGAAIVLAVCGPRPAGFDALLAACALVVLVVPDDAVPGLEQLAVTTLVGAGPAPRVVAVTLPGPVVPRPFRHRPLVRRALAALEAGDA